MAGMKRTLAKRKRRARRAIQLSSGAAAALGAVLAGTRPADAATFNVTNLNDSGPGSLRQAVLDANGSPGPDTILFQPGLTGTITLTSGEIDIADSVDIQGPGAATLAVSGNNSSQVFYLYSTAPPNDVLISGLTIRDGLSLYNGGGIFDAGDNLTLTGVVLTANQAGADGGGLGFEGVAEDVSLTIRSSTISGNTSGVGKNTEGGYGGGIAITNLGGTALLDTVTITGNDARLGGGGLSAQLDLNGNLVIQSSTITNNDAGATATGSGGGIWIDGSNGSNAALTVTDTTISGNTADQPGGGIYAGSLSSLVVLGTTLSGNTGTQGGGLDLVQTNTFVENSTIADNTASAGPGGGVFVSGGSASFIHTTISGNTSTGAGGGIYDQSVSGLTLTDTIVANSTAAPAGDLANDASGSFAVSFSLIETPGSAAINDGGGNILNQDPQLGPLANNGGPTQTEKPALTSPVVDAGTDAAAAVDQRGFPRPAGAGFDIGAVELQPGSLQLTLSSYSVNENGGTATITVTRAGGSDGAASVQYATSDGTATNPADYLPASGTLNWADGDSAPKTFTITIVNDATTEPDETVNLVLSNAQGAALGFPDTAVLTILDDDAAPPPPPPPPPPAEPIPTLGEIGKALFAGLAALAGLLRLRRRPKTAG